MKFLFTKPGTRNLMADNGPLLQFISNTWDDFGYKTQFGVILHTDSNLYELGTVNIAYVDSNEYERMPDTQLITMDWLEQHDLVNSQLEKFPNNLLCLGNADYYGKLVELYSGTIELDALLAATNDIVRNSQLYVQYSDNPVFNASFFRFASEDILSEFGGILDGQAPRKAFDWTLTYTSNNCNQVLRLRNDLGSALPTNMFALIGNNGVGKTSILKDL